MRISLNWLKEYVDLNDISVKDIIHELTMSGLEVEDYTDQSALYSNFIVGEVKSVEKHPNADKLSVCKVFHGTSELQVICGATNVEEKQKVVFAPIGTKIPKGNFEIKKAKIRGIESSGMICAEDELLLSEDHSGIMILDNSLSAGTKITDALNLNDVIIEIGVTPNRPDALSHIGVARDLSAIFKRNLKYPDFDLTESAEAINNTASVIIEDAINCPRYVARVIKDVTIKESPEWLKHKITQIGLRPINNIVDITNFVLYELGQPLHAFDLDLLTDKKIIVKSLSKELKFVTLDSKQRNLQPGTLMICDGEKEVAIAGVMGGENSEITSSTKNILLESAYFNPSSIRRTSKQLQLATDASYRFERGIDYNNVSFAADRAAQLIAELTGGNICKSGIDVYPEPIKNKIVKLRFGRVDEILGYNVPVESIVNILQRLGFKITGQNDNHVEVEVPGFRPDTEREIDLIEEIARIYGYDNIPMIAKINIPIGGKHDDSMFTDKIGDAAVSLGLNEMINNPLQSEQLASLDGNPVALANPLSSDMAYLRTSLLPGALNVVEHNINHGVKDLALFEIGNVFNKTGDQSINSFSDFTENQNFIVTLTGKESDKSWNLSEKQFDLYSLKGILKAFLQKISLDNVLADLYYTDVNTNYDLYYTLNYNSEVIGWGGRVSKQATERFNINQDVYSFELNIDKLKNLPIAVKGFVPPLKYPKVIRDFSFIFDNALTYNEVKTYIVKNSSTLLKRVELFDVFESDALGEGKRSMAFSLEFFDENRTLTEEEVEKEFNKIINLVSEKFKAKLRGS